MYKTLFAGAAMALVIAGSTVSSHADVGAAYQAYQEAAAAGDLELATQYAGQAFDLGRERYGEDNRNTGLLGFNYGSALIQSGFSDLAVTPLEVAVGALDADRSSQDYFDASLELARAYRTSGDEAASAQLLSGLLDNASQSFGASSVQAGLVHLELAELAPILGAHQDVTVAGMPAVVMAGPTDAQRNHLATAAEIFQATDAAGTVSDRVQLLDAAFQMAASPAAGPGMDLRPVIDALASQHYVTDRTVLTHVMWVKRQRGVWSEEDQQAELERAAAFAQFRAEGGVIPLVRRPASYTRAAYRQRRSGDLFYSYGVDGEGQTTDFEVVSGENANFFTESAAAAVTRFVHLPARRGGEAIAVTGLRGGFVFNMEERAVSRTN